MGLWQILTTIWAIFIAGMVTDIWFRVEYTRRSVNKLNVGQRVIYTVSMHALQHTCPNAGAHVKRDLEEIEELMKKENVR